MTQTQLLQIAQFFGNCFNYVFQNFLNTVTIAGVTLSSILIFIAVCTLSVSVLKKMSK